MAEYATLGATGSARPVPWIYRALMVMAAIFMFAMAALTFVDVIGRYFFSAPVPGTFEIVEYLLGLLTFSSLPLVTRDRAHVTVDLFDRFIRGGFRKVTEFCVLLGSVVTVAFIGHRMWSTAWDELAADYVSEYLAISRAPFLLLFSALSAITAAILIMMLWRFVRDGFALKDDPGRPSEISDS